MHTGLNSTVAEINYNEASIIVFDPAPSHQALKALIVWPAATLTQFPFTIAKYRSIDACQELAVESLQCFVYGLCGASAQKTGSLTFLPSNCPSWKSLAPGREDIVTAAALCFAAEKVAAARGSSWFSRKRSSFCW